MDLLSVILGGINLPALRLCFTQRQHPFPQKCQFSHFLILKLALMWTSSLYLLGLAQPALWQVSVLRLHLNCLHSEVLTKEFISLYYLHSFSILAEQVGRHLKGTTCLHLQDVSRKQLITKHWLSCIWSFCWSGAEFEGMFLHLLCSMF